MKDKNIVIYKTDDNQVELRVKLDTDTIWLDQKSIADLFSVNIPAISKHISNIFNDGELRSDRTVSKMEIVRKEGERSVKRSVEVYNLDMILSVGYRVNSKRATQFRIWATNVLRKYLVDGYAINQKRLESESKKYFDLKSQLKTLKNLIENESVDLAGSKELIKIITDYSQKLDLLDKFDNDKILIPASTTKKQAKEIIYKEAVKEIDKLRQKFEASQLFGNEKDDGFKSALKTIFQTFEGKDLYPSLEEKAVNLLYLIIKNHPFSDGNKRIGSFMFIRFLDINSLLYREDNSKSVEDAALVAIALLIAQSDPKDKELMVKLVINLME